MGSLWNPSLRKTLSHPAAVHREKNLKSTTKEPQLGPTPTSKSMRQTNKVKTKPFLTVNSECETAAECDNTSSTLTSTSPSADSNETNTATNINRKYSCPSSDKPPTSKQQPSPSKSKRTFLEGFKNPLRQRKADSNVLSSNEPIVSSNLLSSHSLDSSTGAQTKNKLEAHKDSSVIRRWSESATPLISPSAQAHQQIPEHTEAPATCQQDKH